MSRKEHSTRAPRYWPILMALLALGTTAAGAIAGCAIGDSDVAAQPPPPTPTTDADPGVKLDAGPCPSSQTYCDGTCVDTMKDRANCGTCGKACGAGEICTFGECKLSCPDGLEKCGGTCVNPKTDREHCGACGTACHAGEVCSNGACALSCQESLTNCSGSCVNIKGDRENCGACGKSCAAGEICSGGTCALSCQANLTACGGTCVNTQTDRANCGSCTNACVAGEVCSGGLCALSCQANLTACGGTCVNTKTDRANCGTCGTACQAGEVCSNGACAVACQSGLNNCGGSCANLTTDRAHCGACNVACSSTQVCSNGACACQPGQTACGNTCVDLSTNSNHCGTCGNACGANQVCTAGGCMGIVDGNGEIGKPGLPKVAIVASGSGSITDVKNKLTPLNAFAAIDAINVSSPAVAPTLATLQDYDAVAFYTYLDLADPVALGNVLAAYLENGGGVVAFSNGSWLLDKNGQPTSTTVQGDYATKYALLPKAQPSKLDVALGTVVEVGSPLLAGVTKFDCKKVGVSPTCDHIVGNPINGGIVVAKWTDDSPLVLRRDFGGRKVVELNFFAASSNSSGTWSPTTDGAVLIKNALSFVVPKIVTAVPRLDMGNLAIYTPSPAKTITYRNTSTVPRTINSVTVTGAHIGDFAVTAAVPTPVTLPPGGTLDVGIVFTPTGNGLRAVTVSAAVDSYTTPVTTLLVGKGI